MLKTIFKYSPYFLFPIFWYRVGTYEKNSIRTNMFNRGYNLSQRFKKYPFWDNYVEPLIVIQFAILFTGGNSFIKGLISDNKNKKIVNETIDEFKKEVQEELNIFEDKNE